MELWKPPTSDPVEWTEVCGGSKQHCTVKCPSFLEDQRNDVYSTLDGVQSNKLQPFLEISEERCRRLGIASGMKYYSWKPAGECRICQKTHSLEQSALGAFVHAAKSSWKVYSQPTRVVLETPV